MKDNEDPWGMLVHGFGKLAGKFKLLSPAAAAVFSGTREKTLAPVRVIEDGRRPRGHRGPLRLPQLLHLPALQGPQAGHGDRG